MSRNVFPRANTGGGGGGGGGNGLSASTKASIALIILLALSWVGALVYYFARRRYRRNRRSRFSSSSSTAPSLPWFHALLASLRCRRWTDRELDLEKEALTAHVELPLHRPSLSTTSEVKDDRAPSRGRDKPLPAITQRPAVPALDVSSGAPGKLLKEDSFLDLSPAYESACMDSVTTPHAENPFLGPPSAEGRARELAPAVIARRPQITPGGERGNEELETASWVDYVYPEYERDSLHSEPSSASTVRPSLSPIDIAYSAPPTDARPRSRSIELPTPILYRSDTEEREAREDGDVWDPRKSLAVPMSAISWSDSSYYGPTPSTASVNIDQFPMPPWHRAEDVPPVPPLAVKPPSASRVMADRGVAPSAASAPSTPRLRPPLPLPPTAVQSSRPSDSGLDTPRLAPRPLPRMPGS